MPCLLQHPPSPTAIICLVGALDREIIIKVNRHYVLFLILRLYSLNCHNNPVK